MLPPEKQKPAAGTAHGLFKSDHVGTAVEANDKSVLAKSQAGRRSRRKGGRVELEIVRLHRDLGIFAEKVPLSGAARYQGNGHDVDILAFGRDEAPICAEIKSRKGGEGFATLTRWLGINDLLVLKANFQDPVFVVPLRTWKRLLEGLRK